MSRTTTYTVEMAKRICDLIAVTPKSIKWICANNPDLPDSTTIFNWKRQQTEFSEMYYRAKADQVEVYADQILEIADDSSNDTLADKDGKEYCNKEWIMRCRVRIDSRKWYAGKLAPRIYGDRVQIDTGTKSVMETIIDKLNDKDVK